MEEGTSVGKMHLIGLSVEALSRCGNDQFAVGDAIPGQGVLECIRKQTEKAMGSKVAAFLHGLCLSLCFGVPQGMWLRICQPDKPFSLQVAFAHFF